MAARGGWENPRYLPAQSVYDNPATTSAPRDPSVFYSAQPQIFLPVEKRRASLPFWLQSFSAILAGIALIIAIVLVTGRIKVSGDEGQCDDMGYAKISCPANRPYFNTLSRSCVTASNSRRAADPPTPNCTITAAISNIQSQCADAVSRTGSLLNLASSASCDVTRLGHIRDRIVALSENFPACETPGTCSTPLLPGVSGAPGSSGNPGRLSTWEGPRGPRGVPGPRPIFVGQPGAAGLPGPIGPTGMRGLDSNVVGFPGVPGNAGADGRPGPTGPAGSQGVQGPASSQAGPPGQPGAPGPAGAPSYTAGPPGPPGTDGTDGMDSSTPGPVGPAGPTGSPGSDSTIVGPPGPPGIDGANGVNGQAGPQGPTGPAGAVLAGQPACPKGDPGSASAVVGQPGESGDDGTPGLNGNATIVQIADVFATGGTQHVLVRLVDGRVYAWGHNGNAVIGFGATTGSIRRPTQVLFPAGLSVTQMSANIYTTCYLMNNTRVMCTGWNSNGELGQGATSLFYPQSQTLGTSALSTVPVEVGPGMSGFTDVQVGGDQNGGYVCGIRVGTVFCWGYGAQGQLGEDPGALTGGFRAIPRQVPYLPTGIVALYVFRGIYYSSFCVHSVFARTADGTLYSWGNPSTSMLGRDTSQTTATSFPSFHAAVVQRFQFDTVGLTGIVDVKTSMSDGYGTVIALHNNGSVFGWGYNGYGQAGVGLSAGTIAYPTIIRTTTAAGFPARRIFGGQSGYANTFCAIGTDNMVYCWGNTNYGQAGVFAPATTCSGSVPLYLGPATTSCFTPQRVNGPSANSGDFSWNNGIIEVAMGGAAAASTLAGASYYQTCALRLDGTVWCWGYNQFGNLGDGTVNNRAYASRVANLDNVRAIYSQGWGTALTMFALDQSNTTLWSWGYNGNYNLGIYQPDNFYTPVAVQNLRVTAN